MTLGREASGTVVSVGSDVKGFKEGDDVVYMCGQFGSYSQFSPVEASKVIKVPEGVNLEQAAAVYLQGLTAWTLVREAGEVKPGQWTLVHAAAGGVGLLLVQMLRSVGAKVIGTASTQEKLDLAKKNGAEWTVNSADDLVAKVNEITGGHGVDVIFDGVGKATFEPDLEMVARKGSLISFGNAVSTQSLHVHIQRKANATLVWRCRPLQHPEAGQEKRPPHAPRRQRLRCREGGAGEVRWRAIRPCQVGQARRQGA